ncbi:hypothetical protein [Streptomyces sp. NPDC059247]|uniref:hypothetical protein n=1 Tax=Streptomyces sp. NPDC059247 TaxID=3346790 RepID=UPI0036CC9114
MPDVRRSVIPGVFGVFGVSNLSGVFAAPAPGAWTAVPVPALPDDTPRGPRDRGEPVRHLLGTGVTEP